MPVSRRVVVLLFVLVNACLAGCAPALDWRDVQPEGTALRMQFPCKPVAQQRDVPLAGTRLRLHLLACDADGQTWGLVHGDVGDPGRVTEALQQLRTSAIANLNAAPGNAASAATSATSPAAVPGATPNAASARLRLTGGLPDGRAVRMQVVVFAQGTQVFQATALGAQLTDAAADTFFAALVVRP